MTRDHPLSENRLKEAFAASDYSNRFRQSIEGNVF
jgi:hypothetical protein